MFDDFQVGCFNQSAAHGRNDVVVAEQRRANRSAKGRRCGWQDWSSQPAPAAARSETGEVFRGRGRGRERETKRQKARQRRLKNSGKQQADDITRNDGGKRAFHGRFRQCFRQRPISQSASKPAAPPAVSMNTSCTALSRWRQSIDEIHRLPHKARRVATQGGLRASSTGRKRFSPVSAVRARATARARRIRSSVRIFGRKDDRVHRSSGMWGKSQCSNGARMREECSKDFVSLDAVKITAIQTNGGSQYLRNVAVCTRQ